MKRIWIIIALFSITIAAKGQNATAKKEFNKLLQSYFDTKNALAKDNVGLAGMGAKSMLASLTAFPAKTLNTAQQAEWKAQQEGLKKYVTPIVAEKDLQAQRKNFEYVSSSVIKLARSFNFNDKDIFVQYCPMVKRSWLNEVEEVQNPFYGSKMYDCGEVTDTLAKK